MSRKNETRASVRRAVKGRGFLAPKYSSAVRRFMLAAGGLYLRIVEGVSGISFIHRERITDALHSFREGRQRVIFVFRHAAKEDPPVLMYAFNRQLGQHLRFLYGRDVPNWAPKISVWLFPRIGAIPVQNRAGNRDALDILRSEMKTGDIPVALAPEEQIVYHMYRSFETAPGISSLVKWGLESGKPVAVVPLAIGYDYGKDPEQFIRDKLGEWEELTGFRLENRKNGKLHSLLCDAMSATLSLIEPLCSIEPPENPFGMKPDEIDSRIQTLCGKLLEAGEKALGLPSDGSGMDRLFRLRYAGSDAFYPENIDPREEAPVKRALLDFEALKAEVAIRYERIVDVLEYIHMSYIAPPFSAGRGCEFILNLLDLVNRASGGDISSHSSPSGQKAVILAGEPLLYRPEPPSGGRREFLDGIRSNVGAALQAVSEELEPLWETVKLE